MKAQGEYPGSRNHPADGVRISAWRHSGSVASLFADDADTGFFSEKSRFVFAVLLLWWEIRPFDRCRAPCSVFVRSCMCLVRVEEENV